VHAAETTYERTGKRSVTMRTSTSLCTGGVKSAVPTRIAYKLRPRGGGRALDSDSPQTNWPSPVDGTWRAMHRAKANAGSVGGERRDAKGYRPSPDPTPRRRQELLPRRDMPSVRKPNSHKTGTGAEQRVEAAGRRRHGPCRSLREENWLTEGQRGQLDFGGKDTRQRAPAA
jgi:hypothetical protein